MWRMSIGRSLASQYFSQSGVREASFSTNSGREASGPQGLAAEDALPALRAVAPEGVHLEIPEVEQRDQVVE